MNNNEDKPNLFLLSGWAADYRCWQGITDFLSQYFSLQYIDLAEPCYSIDSLCSDLRSHCIDTYNERLVEKIGSELLEPCHLMGWSLGGMVATQIGSMFPDKIMSLVTLGANARFVAHDSWPNAMNPETFKTFALGFSRNVTKTTNRFVGLQSMGDEFRKVVATKLKDCNVYFDIGLSATEQVRASALLELLAVIDNELIVSEINIPSLMMFADGDALVPVAAQADIKKIKSTNVELSVIKKSGHGMQISHSKNVIRELTNFYIKNGVIDNNILVVDPVCNYESAYLKDKKKIARSFSAAAKSYDSVAQLQRDVADQLLKLQFTYSGTVADLGCGTGYCTQKVLDKNTDSDADLNILSLDLAEGMLQFARQKNNDSRSHWLCGDLENLPFFDRTIDGIVSSLSMQWSDDLAAVFSEAHRTLKPSGWLLCSTLGPNTLHELSESWEKSDPDYVHVNQFVPALKVIDAAEEHGFEMQEFAVEPKVLSYTSVLDLMKDLKSLGAHNINQGYSKGLTGKTVFKKLFDAYETFRRPDNTLPATYEVIYLLMTKRA